MVSTQRSTQPRSSRSTKRRSQGEGSVYFDESRARWVGQVWVDGRRRKVTAKTKIEATAKLGRLVHGTDDERHADRRTTVARLLDEWQRKAVANRDIAPSTRERHAWACALWTNRIGSVKLADLTAQKVERALVTLAVDNGLARASLVEIRGTLRQALTWAQRRRMVTFNAAAVAELPADVVGKRTKKALTPDELEQLLDVLDGHPWRAMYALSARAGLRPGEAAGVCGDACDLDGDPPTVAIVRAVHLERGRPVLGEQLKTTSARRTLAIPADVVAMLRPLVAEQGTGPLFLSSTSGPVWPTTARSELAEACRAAGVPVVTPNELRHTAATVLVDRGLAPHLVADVLGHTTTRMVDAVYRHRPPVIRGAE